MTGFARTNGETAGVVWSWEIRSVNGKGLDLRLRLPPGFDGLEAAVRKAAAERFSRGNLQVSLTLTGGPSTAVPTINDAALTQVLSAIKAIDDRAGTSPSSAAQILGLRGVLELVEPTLDADQHQVLETALLSGAIQALDELKDHRLQEGKAMAGILFGHLDAVDSLRKRAEADPGTQPEAIKSRLVEQITKLLEESVKLDSDRLHQEAALLATRADIREELDRLEAHVTAGRGLVESGSPAGRKLEFLAQEFNRETNTLCSKSSAVSLTETGLEMKVVIDQFREQVLNVE